MLPPNPYTDILAVDLCVCGGKELPSTMKTRLLTTAIGIPLAIAIVTVRGVVLNIAVVLITLLSLWEYNSALSKKYKISTIGGYAAAVLMGLMMHWRGNAAPVAMLAGALMVSIICIMLRREPRFEDLMASVYPLVAAFLPWALIMELANGQFGDIPGIAFIILGLTIAFVTDGFAFFGGRLFGKHKLCPTVSPKKTVEGAVSGVVFGVIAALVCRLIMIYPLKTPMPGVWATLLLSVSGSVVGQFGDLAASLCKRHIGIKDYGNLFPGHGGVMDRFDGAVMIMIVMYCYALML